jgi:hypothetical protein
MTFDQRVKAVSEFGFTKRQAGFLVTVLLHGGICVPRQYARFAGTAYGHKVNLFFDKLVSARYAVRCRCVHNRAAVYHVRHQPLYRAIGEPHSRNRKPVPASRVIERLMLLDAVISHPEIEWLATAADKIGFFTAAGSLDASRWPHLTVGGRRRYFPDHLPIGVGSAGQIVFVFLAASSLTDDLKAFLQRHAELFRALPIWTVRLVLPPYVAPLASSLEAVVRDELAKSQSPVTGRIESEVLPVSYRHLSPLTKLARPITKGVEEGERRGEHTPARPQPPQVEYDADDPAGCTRDWRRLMDAR